MTGIPTADHRRPTRSPTDTAVRRPRLIVSDLDGTFLSPDGTVSARNAAAVKAAEAAGITVVFATGRPIRLLQPIQTLRDDRSDRDSAHSIAIASNGAMVYDLDTTTVLESRTIPAALAAQAFADLRAAIPGVVFGADSGLRAGYEQAYVDLHGDDRLFVAAVETAVAGTPAADLPERYVAELPALTSDGPAEFAKLLALSAEGDADRLTAQVRAALGDRLTATHSSPRRPLVEIAAAGVSKAVTLAALCDRLGIAAADVAAFGDMPNDLEMLRWAGMPHVMAESHRDVLDCGATVIGSNAESAVGATIEGWL